MMDDSINVLSTRHMNHLKSETLFNKTYSIYKNNTSKLFSISPVSHEKHFYFSKKKLFKNQRKIAFDLCDFSQQKNSATKINKISVNSKPVSPKNEKYIDKNTGTATITIKKINYVKFINKKLKTYRTSKNVKKTEKNNKEEKKDNSIVITNNTVSTINTNNISNINPLTNNFTNTTNNNNTISNKSTTTASSYSCNLLSKKKNFTQHKISESNESNDRKNFNISNNYNEIILNYNYSSRTMDNFLSKGLMSRYEEAQNKFCKDYFATYIQKIFHGFYFRRYELPSINSTKNLSAMTTRSSNVYLKKKWSYNSFNIHQNSKQKLKSHNFISSKIVNNNSKIPKIREIEITGIRLKKNNIVKAEIFKRPNKKINKKTKRKKFVDLVNNMIILKNSIDFWRNFVWREKIRKNLINLKKIKEIKLCNKIKNIVIHFDNRKKNKNKNKNKDNNSFLFNTNNNFSFKK